MDLQVLKEIGLTEREIKVYVALLELGKSTAGPICSRAKLAHTKVYDTLQRLVERGLVNYIVVSKTKYFQAEDPKEILNIIDEKRRNLLELISELSLKRKQGVEKQEVVIHEGYSAFKALFNRIISEFEKNDFYYVFALKDDYFQKTAPIFFSNLHKKLEEKKILDRLIANFEVRKEILNTYKGNKNIKIRFVKQNTPVGVAIVKNKIIQMVWGEIPTAIEITSKSIYNNYKYFFEEMWKNARK